MEPAAPGTEDDVPFTATLNKQANEQERLLNLKAVLPRGHYGNVFTLSYNGSGSEHWYCNACQRPVMGRVYLHEQGKRHSIFMSAFGSHGLFGPKSAEGEGAEEGNVSSLQIAPGEPLPPGFEGQVEETTLIQEKLDNFKAAPLVALEYLLEMQYYDPSKEPLYLCVLCDKKGDPRTVLTHLSSYNHISHYLQKHFPTCYRKLAPYMTKQYKRGWQTVLMNIAEAIEQKFGRLKPIPIEKEKFDADMTHYLGIICQSRHFSEKSGHTFEELANHDDLTKAYYDAEPAEKPTPTKVVISKPFKKRSPSPPVVARPTKKTKPVPPAGPAISKPLWQEKEAPKPPVPSRGARRRSLSSVSSISSSEGSDKGGASYSNKNKSPRYRNRKPSPKDTYHRRGDRPQPTMPWQKSNYGRETERRKVDVDKTKDGRSEKLEEFKKLSKAIENDMSKLLMQNEKNPEKHPLYNEEWKKFWNKRYKELQSEGKDAGSYDFKPEWIKFWYQRMIEIHQEEVKNRKDALRRRLGLAISFKITTAKKSEQKKDSKDSKPLPMAARADNDDLSDEVILIEDDKKEEKRRSQSPWEPAEHSSKSRDKRKRDSPPPRKRSRSRSWERRHSRAVSRDPLIKSREPSSRSKDLRSKSRDRSPKDLYRDYRESSFERDLRSREPIRIVSQLPWERSKYYDDYYKPPAIMRDVSRTPMVLPPPILDDEDDNEEVNIVSVLRLLTAVEERLGSLGPKVIDLLAQALALEKNKANSSETLLDNEVNCVLFETVKEKLKGQLLAGLVDSIQERAFKKAIKKTASLIHFASVRKVDTKKNAKVNPVSVPGVGTVDKAAIARQIATALIAQGKTDVTQDQLEQLINAVVGMAEASKKAGKPISTASFLEKLNSGSGDSSSNSTIQDEPKHEVKPIEIEPIRLEKMTEPLTPSPKSSTHNMDHLSDSDLQTLLQNFKDLQTEEQHQLISYLKKLETHEPDRVERLRKFVHPRTSNAPTNVENTAESLPDESENMDDFEEIKEVKKISTGRESPFSKRLRDLNPTEQDQNKVVKIQLDSEDEDYTYEDVVKAVSKNVKAKELEKERQIVEESIKKTATTKSLDLTDAKSIISNLMSNLTKTTNTSSNVDLLGLGSASTSKVTPPSEVPTSMWSKVAINMDNIASIVGNAQNLLQESKKKQQEYLEDFPPVSNENRLNIDPYTLGSDSTSSPSSKPHIIQNIVLNRLDRPNQNQPPRTNPNLGPGRPSFEPNRPDLVPSRSANNHSPWESNMGSKGMQNNGPRANMNYPLKNTGNPYGGNNFPQSNYNNQPQQIQPYQSMRGYDQRPRFNNPRFQGNQFNNRPNGNYNNRW